MAELTGRMEAEDGLLARNRRLQAGLADIEHREYLHPEARVRGKIEGYPDFAAVPGALIPRCDSARRSSEIIFAAAACSLFFSP
jgi:hypothetical protein